ncbi:hypothetical protein [Brevibacillus sp. NRS-1366]|uniref:hypothetical protein n=1 Tax=Brevibacillus sp. NRS-1366 TaxID=3233899 RepID=UPI003D20B12B
MIRPVNEEWTIVNDVYINDSLNHQKFGYKIRNKEFKHKIISIETAKKLHEAGKLERPNRTELSYCSVPRDYGEDLIGLFE